LFDVKGLKLRRNTWIRSSGLPSHLIGWELSDCIEVSEDVMAVVNGWLSSVKSGKIINAIGERSCGKGLAFYGSPGRGKTTLGAAIIQEAMRTFSQDVFSLNDVRPCYFITYASLVDLKGLTMEEYVDESTENLFAGIMGEHKDEYRNIKLLVLDDVGREHPSSSGWNKNLLHHVLRSRFNKGLPTIVTSNILQKNWAEWYGEATGSFTHEAFANIELNSEKGDLRRK
jgi:DNA replication protein DnaC